jgi:hypothetical protein
MGMKYILVFELLWVLFLAACIPDKKSVTFTPSEKLAIRELIKKNIDEGIEATRIKDIETYMQRLPEDLIIYDERGKTISRDQQKEFALRDWAIIDTTLNIKMEIDSIQFEKKDSIIVFTSQRWERLMFQRDGITLDTVLTTQRHREIWKKNANGWFGYEIEELGGSILINGKDYIVE